MAENNCIQAQINHVHDVVASRHPSQQLNPSIQQTVAFLSGKETLKGYTNSADLENGLLDN